MLKETHYIKKTFELAKKGLGFVSPNPVVGAILVKNGKIIGSGYHKKAGTAHAEVNAILSATEDVAGSTLYCNLEPCCHHKKRTGPCADLIIEKKISKVVVIKVVIKENKRYFLKLIRPVMFIGSASNNV